MVSAKSLYSRQGRAAGLCMGYSALIGAQGQTSGSLPVDMLLLFVILVACEMPERWTWHVVLRVFERFHGGRVFRGNDTQWCWAGMYAGMPARILCDETVARYIVDTPGVGYMGPSPIEMRHRLPKSPMEVEQILDELVGVAWGGANRLGDATNGWWKHPAVKLGLDLFPHEKT